MDAQSIEDYTSAQSTSLPARGEVSDFYYGDSLEFLAATAGQMKDIVHYCDVTSGDTKCDASSFDQYDFRIKSLAGYGLAGKITMQDGSRTGKSLLKVDYCKVLPDGHLGVEKTANRDRLKAMETACGSNRRSFTQVKRAIS